MTEKLSSLGEHIAAKLGGAITSHTVAFGELTLTGEAEKVIEIITFLRDDPTCGFINIIDICGVDYPGRDKRFDVVYHFLSPKHNHRIRLKVQTDETTPVASLTDVFPARCGLSARPMIFTAFSSPVTRTCAAC